MRNNVRARVSVADFSAVRAGVTNFIDTLSEEEIVERLFALEGDSQNTPPKFYYSQIELDQTVRGYIEAINALRAGAMEKFFVAVPVRGSITHETNIADLLHVVARARTDDKRSSVAERLPDYLLG